MSTTTRCERKRLVTEYTSDQVREMIWAHMKDGAGPPMTQKDLAAKMGISSAFLCDILRGNREPQGKVLDYLHLDRVVTYRYRKAKRR